MSLLVAVILESWLNVDVVLCEDVLVSVDDWVTVLISGDTVDVCVSVFVVVRLSGCVGVRVLLAC